MTLSQLTLIGCGWLGRQLIPVLLPHYALSATTAHSQTADILPIPAWIYDWQTALLPAPLQHQDCYLILIPPGRGEERAHYPEYMRRLSEQLPANASITLISSTSVYPSAPDNYNEQSPCNPDHPLYQAEIALQERHPQANLLRSAGLYGPDRLPGRRWFGQHCDLSNKRLNLIHAEDIVKAIEIVLTRSVEGKIYNLCAPTHPWRHDFYRRLAIQHNRKRPVFNNERCEADRLIDGSRITRELSFCYRNNL